MTMAHALTASPPLPSPRLLERLELILTTLAGMPKEQRTRPATDQVLTASGHQRLTETELQALRAFGRSLPN